jgi:putative ABC transport system permease protein
MILNYFKIAWRNLNKHRLFSVVNICGLAIGVATFWVIALNITDELSYDRFNVKADRIFRVVQHGRWENGGFNLAVTSMPYAPALKADYPEVEEAIRLDFEGGGIITYNEKKITAGDIAITDNAIFDVFTYNFLSGNAETALSKPQSIVLTKTLALKLFGDVESALDKTVYFNNNYPNTVTGVIDDLPKNAHFTLSGLRSFDANATGRWGNASVFTYLLLKNPADAQKIAAHSADFYNKYLKTELANIHYQMELQPLTSIHLHSNLDYEAGANGNITYIYVFGIVALLILGIAVINYVNLTTARSSVRIKEIGIRKVIGSGRAQLILMFFAESVLLATLATVLALFLIKATLPFFNQLSGKTLDIWQFGLIKSLLIFAGFALITGLISGIYPALFLSGFRTIPAMKGQLGNQNSTIIFRKSLVVFQFVITIVMIVGSCVIYQQLHYVLNKDLGFNKSQMLTFHIHSKTARTKIAAIKSQLLQNPLILSVAAAGNPIGNNDIGENPFNIGPDGNTGPDTKLAQQLIIDEDFIPAMKIKMAQGRNFLKGLGDSSNNAVIINNTLLSQLGWKDPIGRRVRTGIDKGKIIWSTIVGVTKDFNLYSLQHKIAPVVLSLPQTANDEDNLYVRISPKNVQAALQYLQLVYTRFDAENKVEYHFLDQNFSHQYDSEEKQGTMLLTFTVLAISIACLGLFGLVTFTAEQRVKEIGIRKVLGASIKNIVSLLTRDLIQLVLFAGLIATPLAWFAMNKWLQNFAYRVNVQWWVFVTAGAIALLIAFLTVGIRSIKAAIANPAKSLKTE